MVIAKYIGDLLLEYECVVVPGLGGFIINDRPAKINYHTDYFHPPFREIMFNPYLATNDGLLANYIAQQEGITYQEAKQQIDTFVLSCHQALKEGKKIHFDKVGEIYQNENGKIGFEQDESVNSHPDSFGLPSFISPSVRKPNKEELVKNTSNENNIHGTEVVAVINGGQPKREAGKYKQDVSEEREKVVIIEKRSLYWPQVLFVLFLIMIILVGWIFMNKPAVENYYARYGEKIPVFYSNTSSYFANNAHLLPLEKIRRTVSSLAIFNWLDDNNNDSEKIQENVALNNDDFTFKSTGSKNTESSSSMNESKEEKQQIARTDNNLMFGIASGETSPFTEIPFITKEKAEESSQPIVVNTNSQKGKNRLSLENETITTVQESGAQEKIVQNPVFIKYYIIAGSFKNPRNAKKLLDQLKSVGFEPAIAGINSNGMIRIAYAGYPTKRDALIHLFQIRQSINPSAWLMRKR